MAEQLTSEARQAQEAIDSARAETVRLTVGRGTHVGHQAKHRNRLQVQLLRAQLAAEALVSAETLDRDG